MSRPPAPPARAPSSPSRTAARSIPGTRPSGWGRARVRVRQRRQPRPDARHQRAARVGRSEHVRHRLEAGKDAVDGAGVQRDHLPPIQLGGRAVGEIAGLTAHTSQWVCVTMTSGASDASNASSISYSGAPARSRSRTRASMSPLLPSTSNVGRLTAGSRFTQAGKSHSCERATSRSPSPSAHTSSVPLASRDAMRAGSAPGALIAGDPEDVALGARRATRGVRGGARRARSRPAAAC